MGHRSGEKSFGASCPSGGWKEISTSKGGGEEEKSLSHIHFPDGVLPVWLWASGFIVAILVGAILLRLTKKEED